jgi:phosphohistidine swiveling domain-containing protein
MGNILFKKHKKWLSKSCGVVISAIVCVFGIMYAQDNNADQSEFSHLDVKKRHIVQGVGVGDRAVTGVARIVRTLADCDEVRSGDIMVTQTTSDGLLGAMKLCAGIITNDGGSHCHAVAFGKEYGIPVIVGTGNATEKVKNGDIVTLDCSANGIGRVYSATSNDLSQQTTIVHHRAPVVIYQQSSSVQEHKNTHQQQYYYRHDVQQPYHHDYHQDAHVAQCESRQLYITQEIFNQHCPRFIADVVSTKNKYWWGKKTRTIEIGAAAQGCDDFSIKCIPVADDFFLNLSEAEIRSMVKLLPSKYLDYINTLIERCSSKPGDMNWISRVSHEEHIRMISLPADVNKEELIKDPAMYKKIIDQKKVDEKERYLLIAAGLFARYWCENKCKA